MTQSDGSQTSSGDTSVSWGDIIGAPSIPDWIYNPRAFFATIVVGWVFDIWGAILDYIYSVWSLLADIPDVAIYQPITGAFAPAGNAIQDLWTAFADLAMEVSEAAGPFAPIVAVGIWLIPAMMSIATLYFLIGFLGTYLPLRSIPGLRRFA